MSIILPILVMVVAVGLFAPRMTSRWWLFIVGWILLILLYNYVKPPAARSSSASLIGSSRLA